MWVRLSSTDLMAGKVMFLRSNQGGRFDGNESVADSFRSDLANFKSSCTTILGAFTPSSSARKTLHFREAHLLPEPDGHGYEIVSSVRAVVPQKFSVEEELMHVKHVEVKSPHVGVMWKFGRGVISSGIVPVT
ncbi:hypothetical protein TNCV_1065431 [Trichonephila clavipes]|nr:hypothetical protein TNCV_1065431 [Trichonephila clavipes]